MSYLATVTNSVIDTTNIKNILVQGESTHPEIVFSLDAGLTGLTWYVRGAYLGFDVSTESAAITPVETVDAVTVTWQVDNSFTTMYDALQLVLVGINISDETIARATGYVSVARDWSSTSTPAITLTLFEQILAQINAAASHYPYVDETTGNWFVWNPTLEVYEDTEVHAQGVQGETGVRGSLTFSGSAITGTSTTPTVYATGITLAIIGDRYRNTDSGSGSYQNEYVCTLGGDAATALWAYDGNVRGAAGDGVPTGGTTGQGLIKTSGTDYDTSWGDVASLSSGKVTANQASAAIVSVTSARALALTDAGKCLEVDYATAITITIPTNASVAFDIGTEIEIAQVGAGTVTIAGDSGVTIQSINGLTDISGQHASVALKKRATDTWRLEGALA